MTATPSVNLTPAMTIGNWFFALQPTPGLGGGHDQLEDHEPRRLVREASLGAHSPVPDGGEDALDRIRGAQMVPMLGREVEKGQQRLMVLRQAVDGLGTFGLVFVDEDGDRGLSGGPVRRVANLPEAGLPVRLSTAASSSRNPVALRMAGFGQLANHAERLPWGRKPKYSSPTFSAVMMTDVRKMPDGSTNCCCGIWWRTGTVSDLRQIGRRTGALPVCDDPAGGR